MVPTGLAEAEELIAGARRIAVLTGAGISTDSGIPDFRGPEGVWTKNPSAEALFDYDTYMGDVNVRREVWALRRANAAWTARPNAAHLALAELDRAGRLTALITQNIDGLHQKAGTDPEHVLEVHGTIHEVECMRCHARTDTPSVLSRLDEESDPHCTRCGGILKTATISFGQRLDPEVIDAAARAAAEADLFIAIGTSLAVHPAAGLCDVAIDNGAPLIIVNNEPTPYDQAAAAVVRHPICDAVPGLIRVAIDEATI
ncbi:SIR2 family NAD-dependent protein deacylase [Nocardiopsis coralliicola]